MKTILIKETNKKTSEIMAEMRKRSIKKSEMNTIQQNLKDGLYSGNPVLAADDHARLAGEYGWVSSQLEDILRRKASTWQKMRKDVETDKAADRMWEASDDGIDEMGLRLRMKAIEKAMSALKSLIRIAEEQIKNVI